MMNIKHKLTSLAATCGLVLLAGTSAGDDTDIYTDNGPPVSAQPIVMFSLDYRPNLGSTACNGGECQFLIDEGYLPPYGPYTFFDVLRAVLRKVMDPLSGLSVGLMINHDNTANCAGPAKVKPGCSNGGYIALRARPFQKDDDNGAKADFHQFLADMPTPQGNVSHKYQGKELMFEFYRYMTGQGVYNGHVGYLDFSSPPNTNLDVDNPDISWDTSAEVAGNYVSPIQAAGQCTKLYTVNVMFQVSQQDADSDAAIAASVGSGGMGLSNPTFEQVLAWLRDADLADGEHGAVPDIAGTQSVLSYFIVDPSKINRTTIGYAQAGGTGQPLALDEDPRVLIKTLQDLFQQILSVSTTFVAASIPVNVFNRAEVIDNVYVAMFKADPDARPAWNGNLKKLKITGLADNNPQLVDVYGKHAVATDGRVRFDALTYWTDANTLPPADPDNGEIDGRDGRSVPRGGSGQNIPGFTGANGPGAENTDPGARQLFFDDGNQLGALNANLETAVKLQTHLSVGTAAESLVLLQYARGMDIADADGDGSTTDARRWIMGDPLHSRPLPLNYGAFDGHDADNPAIFIAVASNDGILRFIRNTNADESESGAEIWGFMPRSVMQEVKTLATNVPGIKHPYMVDGAPVAYVEDANQNGTIDPGEKAYVYVGLRRGGKGYYALDVSNPYSPRLLWKIEKGGDFAELGMTFSTPRVIKVKTPSGPRPALIFGGGYDTNKDSRGATGTNDAEGNAIYVVDAESGDLIWKAKKGTTAPTADTFFHAGLTDSIPSSMAILDSDGDRLHDRAYVGDTGGNVWRADMHTSNPSDWRLTRLANLGRHQNANKSQDRRFFHRPDVIQHKDQDGPYDAVVIGSGDRPDPLDRGGIVENWMYMIKDRNFKPGTGLNSSYLPGQLGDITNTCLQQGSECTADLDHGWRLELEGEGEKSLATALTVANTVYFTTYLPTGGGDDDAGDACSGNEGAGRLYAINLNNGAAVNNYDSTTEENERHTLLDSRGIPAQVVSLPSKWILRPDLTVESTNASTRFQTYWFEEEDSEL